ncbi:MAG: hypothetical protein AAFX09_08865 [Pseudomonadota bacterium]
MSEARTLRILVTGVGAPPGLAALRSLASSGLDVELLAADAAPYAAGLYEPDVEAVILPSARDSELYRSTVRRLSVERDVDIVLPGSEAEAGALAPVAAQWREEGVEVPVPAPDVLHYGIDKGALLERIIALGLPAPKTLRVEREADLGQWDGGYPCVLKPRSSRGARGVSYPDDAAALVRDWRRTSAAEGPCLVQSYIPGGAETVYTVGAVFLQGRLILSTVHHKLATNPPSGGAATAGQTVIDEPIRKAGLAILDATGPWHGFAAVELKRSTPDAEPKLLEINPRLWGFAQMMTLAGVNAPAMLVRALRGDFDAADPPPGLTQYRPIRVLRTWHDREMPAGAEPEDLRSRDWPE